MTTATHRALPHTVDYPSVHTAADPAHWVAAATMLPQVLTTWVAMLFHLAVSNPNP